MNARALATGSLGRVASDGPLLGTGAGVGSSEFRDWFTWAHSIWETLRIYVRLSVKAIPACCWMSAVRGCMFLLSCMYVHKCKERIFLCLGGCDKLQQIWTRFQGCFVFLVCLGRGGGGGVCCTNTKGGLEW